MVAGIVDKNNTAAGEVIESSQELSKMCSVSMRPSILESLTESRRREHVNTFSVLHFGQRYSLDLEIYKMLKELMLTGSRPTNLGVESHRWETQRFVKFVRGYFKPVI